MSSTLRELDSGGAGIGCMGAFQVIPKVAIAPLLAIWLNGQFGPTVAMGSLIAFFPIYKAFREGLRADKTGLRRTLAVLGPNKFMIFFNIKVPEAIPLIFQGARVGITFAVVGVIVGEMVRPSRGLGYIIEIAKGDDRVSLEYAAIMLVSVLGALLYLAVQAIQNSKVFASFFPAASIERPGIWIEGDGPSDPEL